MSNTIFATDVYMSGPDNPYFRRPANPVLPNKTTPSVEPPETPSLISCTGATADLGISLKLHRTESGSNLIIRDANKTALGQPDVILTLAGYMINEGVSIAETMMSNLSSEYQEVLDIQPISPTTFSGDEFTASSSIAISALVPDVRLTIELNRIDTTGIDPLRTVMDIAFDYDSTPTYVWDIKDDANANYKLNVCISSK